MPVVFMDYVQNEFEGEIKSARRHEIFLPSGNSQIGRHH
jgi:hypothetical protein